jgi:hypothetical protein
VKHLPHLFDIMRHCCVLCDRDRSIYPWKTFGGRCTVPICFDCQRKHGTRGRDTITSVLEQQLLEIFASEPAFWHPGDAVGSILPEEREKEL